MRIKAIDSVAKKVGGIENLIIYFLLALIIILIAVFLRLNFLVNLKFIIGEKGKIFLKQNVMIYQSKLL